MAAEGVQLPLHFPQKISRSFSPGLCQLCALISTRLGSWEQPVIHWEAVPKHPGHGPATPGCGGLEIAITSGCPVPGQRGDCCAQPGAGANGWAERLMAGGGG